MPQKEYEIEWRKIRHELFYLSRQLGNDIDWLALLKIPIEVSHCSIADSPLGTYWVSPLISVNNTALLGTYFIFGVLTYSQWAIFHRISPNFIETRHNTLRLSHGPLLGQNFLIEVIIRSATILRKRSVISFLAIFGINYQAEEF